MSEVPLCLPVALAPSTLCSASCLQCTDSVKSWLWPQSWPLPQLPCTPLQNHELILHDGAYKVVQRGPGGDRPYRVRYMGTHLAVETRGGLVVSWDRKTSVFIRLHQDYKVKVGGLQDPLRPGQSLYSYTWPYGGTLWHPTVC